MGGPFVLGLALGLGSGLMSGLRPIGLSLFGLGLRFGLDVLMLEFEPLDSNDL